MKIDEKKNLFPTTNPNAYKGSFYEEMRKTEPFKQGSKEFWDPIKAESPPFEIKLEKLDVDKYLNEKATALYNTKLGSTVIEYYQCPTDGDRFALAIGTIPVANLTDPDDPIKYVNSEPTWELKCSLIHYLGVRCVADSHGRPPEKSVKKWAEVLNRLADSGVWQFGTLASAFCFPLLVDAKGELLLERSLDNPFGDIDTSQKTVRSRIGKRGQQLMLTTYIGVHPAYAVKDYEKGVELLNQKYGNFFVFEGETGREVWNDNE